MPSSRQGATEDVIAGISERPKIAYVHHDLEVREVSYRHLGSLDITKEKHRRGRQRDAVWSAPSSVPCPPQAG